MTLKDFHGGSIPSDLPLPSAPGVSVRPLDRPGSWGPAAIGAAGKADHHRPRPGSAGGGSRAFDERPPVFLSHASHIGRHFDEDERKPFDASSGSRHLATPDPVLPALPATARSDQKRPIPSPATHPYPAAPVSGLPLSSGSNVGPAPNAWAARKEHVSEPLPTHSTTTMWTASRLAQASAVEKMSSGRWQSKPPDVEAIRFQETEVLVRRFGESVRIVDDGDRDYERERMKSTVYPEAKERTLTGFYADGARDQERVRSPVNPEVKERNAASLYDEGARSMSSEGRFSGPQLHQQGVVEALERPKLKLLPKTKPLEPSSETRGIDDNKGYQPSVSSVQIASVHEMHATTNPLKVNSAVADDGSKAVERPRLSLKPRSLPVEQLDESAERTRQTVFGGARPREIVLKERRIDVVAANDLDMTVATNRVKDDLPKTDSKLEPAPTTRPGGMAETFTHGQRTGRDLDRKDHRPEVEKVDVQKSSWRNDNWRTTREIEKPLEQPRPEPDTWRKPVEDPEPDLPGPRFGKAASALDLARAFSKSVSDGRSENHFPSQGSLPGRTQAPFSRLTDCRTFYSGPPKRQSNGY
ncbi:putative DNA helicase INO80 [Cocos nucifera]|uniref:Putative DNA helicase INO80 n=1 Tax=Cocos nucifera TaxID=13894 RepID=A0A8K0IVG1_COCNU|nr:putative DNA helicase INO80 [Cocos nucifera]